MNQLNAHLYLPLVQSLSEGMDIQANRGTVDEPRWEAVGPDVKFTCEPHLYRAVPKGVDRE